MTTSTKQTPRVPADQKQQWTAEIAANRLAGHKLPPSGFDFAAASETERAKFGFPR